MNLLVTGATGFVGRHLIAALPPQITVYALGRSRSRTLPSNCIPVVADMSELHWTDALPSSVNAVVSLAQSSQYRNFPEGTEDMVRINVTAIAELLEWSRINQVSKFLFASTGNVYAPSNDLHKETDVCEATSMYAATKLSAEWLVRQYIQYFQTTTMRLFSIYGLDQKNMLIPTLIERIQAGREIILAQGTGLYLTPLYISDCVTMITRLLRLNETHHEVYNVAGSKTLDLGAIVHCISDSLGKTPNIRITDDRPSSLQGDNTKICEAIDYQPVVNFPEGIQKTLEAMS